MTVLYVREENRTTPQKSFDESHVEIIKSRTILVYMTKVILLVVVYMGTLLFPRQLALFVCLFTVFVCLFVYSHAFLFVYSL